MASEKQPRLARVVDESQELIRRAKVAVERSEARRVNQLSRRREPPQLDPATEAVLRRRLDSPAP